MCGRYWIDDTEEFTDYYDVLQQQYGDVAAAVLTPHTVFPSQPALIFTVGQSGLQPGILKWGYPKWDNKGLLINTRLETAAQKPTFRYDYRVSRCVIAANGFFEWDPNKRQYRITSDINPLYMAGIWHPETGVFSILTKQSYDALATIHNRTPILFDKEEAIRYCSRDFNGYDALAHQACHPLLMQPAQV